MSQFIHHRLLLIMAAGTKALLRCDGVLFLCFGGIFYLKNYSHGTTQTLSQEGWLLAPCGRTVSPCFPFASSSLTTSLFLISSLLLFVPSHLDVFVFFGVRLFIVIPFKRKEVAGKDTGVPTQPPRKKTAHYHCGGVSGRRKQPPSILM